MLSDLRFALRRFTGFSRGACLLTSILATGSIRAEDTKPIANIVEAAAKSFMSDPQSVGLSLGVFQGDKDFTFDFGSTTRGRADTPTARTLYPIASITKTFTGSLLALAAVEGKLLLDEDVRKHLPGSFPNLEFAGRPIRLRDLLNHRSGLPFILPDRPELMPGYQNEPITVHLERTESALSGYSRSEFFADLRHIALEAEPGKNFKYSNSAAQLAGYVLENIYQTSFEKLVQEKIARPLGLDDTAIILTPVQRGRLAHGYDGDGTLLPPPSEGFQAAGALKSNVTDLLKYLRWHTLESDAAVKLSHQPTFTEGNYSAALNWQILSANGRRLIWQEGNVPGFTSYLLFEPELNVGLVILTNESDRSSSKRIATLANEILKALDARSIPLP